MNDVQVVKYKFRLKKLYIPFVLLIFCLLILLFTGKSFSEILDSGSEVTTNSELIYYLNVEYDGVDKKKVVSNDNTIAEVRSDYIYVEDKIPEGLTFTGFVTTEDGTIGAVERSSGSPCVGKVLDDTNEASLTDGVWNATNTEYTYHGLHYNADTRVVSFKVTNLKAGCKLTVGIKTTTPAVIDDPNTTEKETRLDFYNFATARENMLTVNSNTVHTFMGSSFITKYNIIYKYSGDIPENAPELPIDLSFVSGAKVNVSQGINLSGYTFSGWNSNDVVISDGVFTMPSNDVVIEGSFTKNQEYSVFYQVIGEVPSSYTIPSNKTYNIDDTVYVDALESGTIIDDYKFIGWTTNDLEVSDDNKFVMPNKNVVFTGQFEKITYSLSYNFYDSVLPDNYETLLPETEIYNAGDEVTLATIEEPEGYKFSGWYNENTFAMPNYDLAVYGEWMVRNGTFEPELDSYLKYGDKYYRPGDIVHVRVGVKNTSAYEINDVLIEFLGEGVSFESSYNNSVVGNKLISILSIPANESFYISGYYEVKSSDMGVITLPFELKSAISSNSAALVESEYKTEVSFKTLSKIKICEETTSNYDENVFQYKVTSSKFDFLLILNSNECKTLLVEPDTYSIIQVTPQEYKLSSVEGDIITNNASLEVEFNETYEVKFTNQFKRKGFYHSFGRVKNLITYVKEDE